MPVWPNNPSTALNSVLSIADGDAANVSHLSLGTHAGTHMDAPRHFVADGAPMDALPIDAVIGPARVVAIEDPERVTAQELARHAPRAGERLLLRTRNSPRCWATNEFVEDFVYISEPAARLLVSTGVRTVGVDYLSVGGYARDGVETHTVLLEAGVWIIEGLDLSAITPGDYELVCLPIKLVGADGAPARAALRPRD